MDDNTIITFGVHKGKKLANVPPKYLLWLDQQPWLNAGLKAYIKDNREVLEKEIENQKK